MNYELAKELDRMIDYPLAVELKSAGFPQKQGETYLMGENHEIVHDLAPYRPTLFELIEACGHEFDHLKKVHGDWKWEAYYNGEEVRDDQHYFFGKGSTPEEAVARLWLALNLPDVRDKG